jgi:hypothetical protein
VPRELIEHSLNVDPKATPKRQHLHRFAEDRRDAIKKELAKLLAAGFIREVLSKLGSTRAQVPAGVFVHELHAASIPEPVPLTTVPAHPPAGQEVMMIDMDWRKPFIDYLSEQKIPSDKNLAEQLICHAKSYVLVRDKLDRRGASSGVLMKCVPRQEGKDILEEIQRASAATTRPLARWSARPSDELSTGPQLWATPKNSSEGAKGASTSPSSNTSQPTS